jgi:hypothetical protein
MIISEEWLEENAEGDNNVIIIPALVYIGALCYKPEGRGMESRWGGFFDLPNLSSRSMALASTHPLKEMITRNLSGG